jgi:hypothetical protein
VKPILARHCLQCKSYQEVILSDNQDLFCPQCKASWGKVESVVNIFDRCPVCQARQFYTSKDFNQFLGCLVMLIGIVLVPWTYGLSLPVFALIDWAIHKRVPTIVICYKCATEFKNLPFPKHLKPFMHHIGLKYDKYR